MSSVAFVFPGQGSQFVGMGKALAEAFPEAKAVFDAADDALEGTAPSESGQARLSTLCFEGPEDVLKLTANTQPAILTVSIAAHAVFTKRFKKPPAFVAGHSLGEYSALVAAQSMSLADAVRAVRARGTFMQEAVPHGIGAMSAVLGLASEKVAEVCRAVANGEVVSCANFNEPSQTVIAGHAAAVERASALLRESGAKRVLQLPVSAPFHCELMSPVVPRLKAVLDRVVFHSPISPIVSNVEAVPNSDPSRIEDLLLRQVTSSVRWVECVQTLEKAGVTKIVELGPGKVLCGLIKRISKTIECVNVEDPASLDKALATP
jgi:[acyl-carrier-protein] S-malonyltransferase